MFCVGRQYSVVLSVKMVKKCCFCFRLPCKDEYMSTCHFPQFLSLATPLSLTTYYISLE